MKIYGAKYEDSLTGGHPNSLGKTIEIVDEVLDKPDIIDALAGAQTGWVT